MRSPRLSPILAAGVAVLSISTASLFAQAFEPLRFGDPAADDGTLAPFFDGVSYDPEILDPAAVLGQPLGTRLARPAEVIEIFDRWAGQSPRVRVYRHGATHEGRELIHAVISSPANLARLDEILGAVGRLADPRALARAEGERLVDATPAVAWLGYSIHGDETSGVDAALAVGRLLIAGRGERVASLLDELVVVIDPVLNPDGRQRYIGMLEQMAGYVPNLDSGSAQRGAWPFGRGNHYLFDLNRDWIAGTQPETRGRWAVLDRYRPQLVVDAHEMGSLDTYLFYPPRAPFNSSLPRRIHPWWKVFGDDQGRAFDRYGWSYYTREWAESFYPGYTDSWGAFIGAVGILYEQAGYGGGPLRRPSGEVVTYRQAVHRQAVSSLANLETLAANRREVLSDYLAEARRAVAPSDENDRAFVLVPGRHPDRERRLVELLLAQGIEIGRAEESFACNEVAGVLGERHRERRFPAGSWVMPRRQPRGALLATILDFDPRPDSEALAKERKALERDGSGTIYDVTAWSLAHSFDVDGWWCRGAAAETRALTAPPEPPAGAVVGAAGAPPYGWVVDGRRDAALSFAVEALERGLAVRLADRAFTRGGRELARGSLLVRRHENGEGVADEVAAAARAAGVEVHAVTTARSPDDGPDLGGGHFALLERPRIGLVTRSPVAPSDFGHLWHYLDVELGVPYSMVDVATLGFTDLRRFNVLILPPAWSDLGALLEPHAETLAGWVESGGTLIGMAGAAATLSREKLGLSQVRRRRDALDDLEVYARAVERERTAGRSTIDEAALWDDEPASGDAEDGEGSEESDDAAAGVGGDDSSPLAEHDAWLRRFSPQGAFVRARVDDGSWLTVGAGEELPVLIGSSDVYLARPPAAVPVRLAPAGALRLSGLVWPEARERLGDSAFLTRESRGAGQVILFAASPVYRGMSPATARLLGNAVVYGPGAGAWATSPW